MKIEEIQIYQLSIPFIRPFQFSNGELCNHDCLIVAVKSEGIIGWGECPVFPIPYYTYETIATASHILKDFLIPQLLGKSIDSLVALNKVFSRVRGHNMAKSCLDAAICDLLARVNSVSLSQFLGGEKKRIQVGVSVSMQDNLIYLLQRIEDYIQQGYQRIKLKIAPNCAIQPLKTIREKYPYLTLMADANSSFSLNDIDLLKALDEFDLLMIEQPLAYDDLLDHAYLQTLIKTPICLDESINNLHDTRVAIALQAGKIINLKPSRVGGISNALQIHDLCQKAGIKLWCGGMLESGIGRATNLHLASLSNFTLPADISATNRYFYEDIIHQVFSLNSSDSTIDVPQGFGIGVDINQKSFNKFVQTCDTYR
ncbi:o-succinylbenzoate synthase [Cyanobacterium aponinum]|uniref:o-succinylbenzoate synthase n=1 Tax=Cyanobacterium aponinum 0216 TaxID=2676140 RepID=A0A844GSQ4_9CHRO|nr:o-succinylbenzoate synthase [Cyanobacterium aponinum]MTF37949.1 o-succinylbenzoate synthase [Cyanobacterium aponinum 0216]